MVLDLGYIEASESGIIPNIAAHIRQDFGDIEYEFDDEAYLTHVTRLSLKVNGEKKNIALSLLKHFCSRLDVKEPFANSKYQELTFQGIDEDNVICKKENVYILYEDIENSTIHFYCDYFVACGNIVDFNRGATGPTKRIWMLLEVEQGEAIRCLSTI